MSENDSYFVCTHNSILVMLPMHNSHCTMSYVQVRINIDKIMIHKNSDAFSIKQFALVNGIEKHACINE